MAKKSTQKPSDQKPLPAGNPFEGLKGEQFGGQTSYFKMEPSTRVDGFTHVKWDKNVELQKGNPPIDIPVAIHPDTHEEIRLPASAVFRANYEKSDMKPGDEFSIARLADTTKKTGRGKGNKMEVYALLVTKRKK